MEACSKMGRMRGSRSFSRTSPSTGDRSKKILDELVYLVLNSDNDGCLSKDWKVGGYEDGVPKSLAVPIHKTVNREDTNRCSCVTREVVLSSDCIMEVGVRSAGE